MMSEKEKHKKSLIFYKEYEKLRQKYLLNLKIIFLLVNDKDKSEELKKDILNEYSVLYFGNLKYNKKNILKDYINNTINLMDKECYNLLHKHLLNFNSKNIDDFKKYIYNINEDLRNKLYKLSNTRDYNNFMREIRKIQNTDIWQNKRLILTESARAYNQGLLEEFKDKGIQGYEIVNVNDPCDICDEYMGGIQDIYSGELPPYHPNCRCYIVPIDTIF